MKFNRQFSLLVIAAVMSCAQATPVPAAAAEALASAEIPHGKLAREAIEVRGRSLNARKLDMATRMADTTLTADEMLAMETHMAEATLTDVDPP
ncbi:hypothetical protein SISNIDRAFT_484472 [Sistotremastrum niveocremeum HHB9708]|uniref:Uncharacterized protein n=1 Tax=Sistotremastrum niveocremeum HHB9708 TaxID=1314777 RepID=A0A164WDE4_9AGAM|nr:hypothetical protein SISNIDRAFT_484472 [Sistotremastrum niveocremeum HHB9708]